MVKLLYVGKFHFKADFEMWFQCNKKKIEKIKEFHFRFLDT